MAIRDLIPKFGKKSVPMQRSAADPFTSLQEEINRVFDNFGRGVFDLAPLTTHLAESSGLGGFSPKIDVKESDKSFDVTAELPGMDEKDVQVSLTDNEIVIRGEKRAEKEEKGKEWYRMERSYGAFHRAIALPENVDSGKAEAAFKKGVLSISIPKLVDAKREAKKITIHRG